jgi:phage anti-repressor protein
MNELITITQTKIGTEEVNAVDARELWVFLESKQDFSTWTKNRIEQYGFVQGVDFIQFHNFVESDSRARIEYTLSLDMAKELSMVERNAKGKQARQYFIECERRLRQGTTPVAMTTAEQFLALAQWQVEQERKQNELESKVEAHDAQLKVLTEGENYFTIVGYCNIAGVRITTQEASRYGKKATAICRANGYVIGTAPHPVYGRINTYPRDILEEILP